MEACVCYLWGGRWYPLLESTHILSGVFSWLTPIGSRSKLSVWRMSPSPWDSFRESDVMLTESVPVTFEMIVSLRAYAPCPWPFWNAWLLLWPFAPGKLVNKWKFIFKIAVLNHQTDLFPYQRNTWHDGDNFTYNVENIMNKFSNIFFCIFFVYLLYTYSVAAKQFQLNSECTSLLNQFILLPIRFVWDWNELYSIRWFKLNLCKSVR